MEATTNAILKNLQMFVAFARKRLGDPHLAEDAVQESLVKALRSNRHPVDEEDTVTWFYRILRRTIIDLYRRNNARTKALDEFERELPQTPRAAEERMLCQCFKRLLPVLPPQYGELVRRVDLEGNDLQSVAADLGVTKNSLTVRLHRARKQLREELARNCRACSKHGCLDCSCEPNEEGRVKAIKEKRRVG